MMRHCGFDIPLAITMRPHGYYWRPGSGICSGCHERRPTVYIVALSEPYCSGCIMYDLVEHSSPSDEMKLGQHHPPEWPTEIMWEKVQSVFTDETPENNLDIYRQAFK